ncbi:ParB N-terminal domain-containing protein [Anaerobacillus sp. MEB173]|uniref:hypothetical protein n=1 Tax=Anaerobacillus sp. MEB173 TaxID=3383345 RepID=UPI003F901118
MVEATYLNVGAMYNSLIAEGLISSIVVEGPNKQGEFYVIDGVRRVKAMKQAAEKFPQVECNVIREITSKEKRNETRLKMQTSEKRSTMLEKQKMYNDLDELGKDSLPRDVRKRLEKGSNIPEYIRDETAKAGSSKEAMEVIYYLDINESFRNSLFKRLWNRDITGIHATALKRIIKHPLFPYLNDDIKHEVINKVIKEAEFTVQKGSLIIEKTIMKHNPEMGKYEKWIIYICKDIQEQLNLIKDSTVELMTDESIREVKKTIEFMYEKFKIHLHETQAREHTKAETKDAPFQQYHSEINPIVKINGKEVEYLFVH